MKSRAQISMLLATMAVAALLVVLSQSWARSGSVWQQLDLLVDVRHQLARFYVENPDTEAMVRAAVRGMVESLDDPYTVLIEDMGRFDREIDGRFSGIGAEVDLYENRLRIVSPLEDSPAWKAGVMAGDIVLDIDGQSTEGITIDQAVDRLTGEAGTQVTIRVRHRSGEEQSFTITRDVISVQTVRGLDAQAEGLDRYWLDPEKRIAYLRITQFTGTTLGQLQQTLEKLRDANIHGLVLDLRFNPGGRLDVAVEVCDLFLPRGQRIVSVRGRSHEEEVYTARRDPLLAPEIPIVVLANEASASASEIVAGALADNNRALAVGTRTFGKGSVQSIRQLLDGSMALKLTTAYYYLPAGRTIHRRPDAEVWGVDPSEGNYVPMTSEQVRRMIEQRRNMVTDGLPSAPSQTTERQTWLEETLHDPQLAAAYRAMLGRMETGSWPQVGQMVTDELIRERRREQLMAQKAVIEEALKRVSSDLERLDDPSVDPAEDLQAAQALREALERIEAQTPEDIGTIDLKE